MESDGPVVPGYLNRPTGHARADRRPATAPVERAGRRTRIRIARVALRAYEQRAERHAILRGWIARHAASGASGPAPARG